MTNKTVSYYVVNYQLKVTSAKEHCAEHDDWLLIPSV